jgi:hippurate hydrolase
MIPALHDELTAIRRDLHAHPELGMEEVRTAGLVATHLRDWGLDVTEGVGNTGVVGTLRGRREGGRSIGIRADMDALALQERTGLPHQSTVDGRMHACGHDGHTTVLLGAAKVLAEDPDFAGTVHFVFQPAEEGRGGARAMLADGLFDRFPCDAVYGLHSAPFLPAGMIAVGTGPLMAAAGEFSVTFFGNGGHGGLAPHAVADLSIVQAHYVLALQTIVGRNVPAAETAVISVGYVQAGNPSAPNVMPDRLVVGGTLRSFTPETTAVLEKRIPELAHGLAALHNCTAEVDVKWIAAPVINPVDQAGHLVRAATAAVGERHVLDSAKPLMASEDFSFLMEATPGAFAFLGTAGAAGAASPMVHTPLYDFNDDAIPTGVALWQNLVRQQLA